MHASLSHIAIIEALANRMGPYMLPAFHTSPSMISDEGKGKRYVEDQAHGGFESIGTIAPQRTVLRDQTWNNPFLEPFIAESTPKTPKCSA